MVDQEYVSELVVFGKSSPANLVLLKNRVTDLFSYITLNQGKDLTTVSIPDQHLNWSKTYTAQEEFSGIQQALSIIAGQPTIIEGQVGNLGIAVAIKADCFASDATATMPPA